MVDSGSPAYAATCISSTMLLWFTLWLTFIKYYSALRRSVGETTLNRHDFHRYRAVDTSHGSSLLGGGGIFVTVAYRRHYLASFSEPICTYHPLGRQPRFRVTTTCNQLQPGGIIHAIGLFCVSGLATQDLKFE